MEKTPPNLIMVLFSFYGNIYIYTVKHVYSDHAYNEIMLITKHFGIPGKHSIHFFINFTHTAKLHITKLQL